MSQNLNAREFADSSYLQFFFFPSTFRGAQFLTNSHNTALTMGLKPRIHQHLLVEKITFLVNCHEMVRPDHPVWDPCGWRLKLLPRCCAGWQWTFLEAHKLSRPVCSLHVLFPPKCMSFHNGDTMRFITQSMIRVSSDMWDLPLIHSHLIRKVMIIHWLSDIHVIS